MVSESDIDFAKSLCMRMGFHFVEVKPDGTLIVCKNQWADPESVPGWFWWNIEFKMDCEREE